MAEEKPSAAETHSRGAVSGRSSARIAGGETQLFKLDLYAKKQKPAPKPSATPAAPSRSSPKGSSRSTPRSVALKTPSPGEKIAKEPASASRRSSDASGNPPSAKRQKSASATPAARVSPRSPAAEGTAKKPTPSAQKTASARKQLLPPSAPAAALRPMLDHLSAKEVDSVKAVLDVSAVPSVAVCRERERAQVFSFVKERVAAGTGGAMYLSGVPGIGKTLTLRELARAASGDWGVRRVVTLNCMKNPETIPQQILDGLGGAAQYLDGEKAAVRAVAGNKAIAALQRIVTVPFPKPAKAAKAAAAGKGGGKAGKGKGAKGSASPSSPAPAAAKASPKAGGGKRKRQAEAEAEDAFADAEEPVAVAAEPVGQAGDAVLVILDEIDALTTKKDCDILYDIFSLSMLRGSRCVIVAAANDLSLTDRVLPMLHARNCAPRTVQFCAYSYSQLLRIIASRTEAVEWAVFHPKAVELCARKVAMSHGDVRRMLAICCDAVDVAHRDAVKKQKEAEEEAARRAAEEAAGLAAACGEDAMELFSDLEMALQEQERREEAAAGAAGTSGRVPSPGSAKAKSKAGASAAGSAAAPAPASRPERRALVSVAQMAQALRRFYSNAAVERVAAQTLHAQLVLLAALKIQLAADAAAAGFGPGGGYGVRRASAGAGAGAGAGAVGGAGTLRALHMSYCELCRRHKLPPSTEVDFSRVADALENEGLLGIEAQRGGNGWGARPGAKRMSAGGLGAAHAATARKYHIKVDLGDVRYGLQGSAALSRILLSEIPPEPEPEAAAPVGDSGAGAAGGTSAAAAAAVAEGKS